VRLPTTRTLLRRLGPLAAALALAVPAGAASPGREAMNRGVELYRAARYADAVKAFREATERDPGLLEAWDHLGWSYHRSGQHAQAVTTWETVLKVDPKRWPLLNEMAAIRLAEGRWREAAELFARSLAVKADQPLIRLRLALANEKSGAVREAEQEYREGAKASPGNLAAALRLQEFLERTGRPDDALEFLRGAAPHLSGNARAVVEHRMARLAARRGDAAYKRGDQVQAQAAFQEAVRLEPGNAQYHINLGWTLRNQGRTAEAAAAWTRALALEPDRTSLYRHLADASYEQEDLAGAAAFYDRAWQANERRPSVAYRLAEIALAEGRVEEGRHWLAELFRLPGADEEWSPRAAALYARSEQVPAGIEFFRRRPRNAAGDKALSALHAYRGAEAYRASDYAAAQEAFAEALRLDPANRHALRDAGWTYWMQQRLDDAGRLWAEYRKAYPQEAQPLNLLGRLRYRRKDYAGAVAAARASLELEPDQPAQKLFLAQALWAAGDFAASSELAESLAKAHPEDGPIQVFWGDLLMQYHRFDAGKPQWRRVLDLGTSNPRAGYYWVKSMYELGEYERAVAEAKQLVQQDPKQNLLQFLADDAVVRGADAEAVQWYRQIVDRYPERLPAWLELARLQQAIDPRAAKATLVRAQSHHPERLEVKVAQAQLEQAAGRAGSAYDAFGELGRAHPEQRDVFWGRFQTALESGQGPKALAVLRADGGEFLKEYEQKLVEARTLYEMNRVDEARRALDAVVRPRAGTVYVPALLYHGIGDHERSASVPAAVFEDQMKALHGEGWTSITLPELVEMLDGRKPFPSRPILITFDDARRDSFERADPVLARYGFRATMFVPTARILDGHPFFADWDTIRTYATNGRWDLQSHGHKAHDLIVVDGAQQMGSFLVNREWLEDEGRLESYEEYAARLDADYARSIDEIARRFPEAKVVGYAFPFSEAGHQGTGNEPKAAEANRTYLARKLRFGFVQDGSGYNAVHAGLPMGTVLRRYSVPRDLDGEGLLRHLSAENPRTAALAQRARMEYWGAEYDRARSTWSRIVAEQPRMAAEAAYYLAAIQYQRGRYGAARRELDVAASGQAKPLQADPLLAERIRWASGARIQPRLDYSSDSQGRTTLARGVDVEAGALGPFATSFGVGWLGLRETGFAPLDGLEASGAVAVRPLANWTFEGRAAVRRFAETGSSFGARAFVGYEGDRAELRFGAGKEDLDTLRARRFLLQAEQYSARGLYRWSRAVVSQLDGVYARLDDGNRRVDATGKLLFQPRWARGVGVGAVAGWSDTRFLSPLYYSPEEVRWAGGLVAYRGRWGAGWTAEAELGLGLAEDAREGRRRIVRASGRLGQSWGDRVRTLFEGRYGSSPGYSGWGLGADLQFLFP
jgi:tetratricopeptide (TPR) repeat protein